MQKFKDKLIINQFHCFKSMKKIYKMLWLLALLAVMPVANVVAQVAKIGSTDYATLEAAVAAANAGETVSIVTAGTYTVPNISTNITIEGGDGVVFNCVGAEYTSIASIPNGATFKNVTLNMGNVNYHGFQHAGTINMEGCKLNGKFFSYGDMNFTNCQFVHSGDYHMWVYGKGTVTYTNCTFTNDGKFLHLYSEDSKNVATVNVTGCTFINTTNTANKAAINVKATCGAKILDYTVNVENSTAEGAFPAASSSDKLVVLNPLVQVDDRPANPTTTEQISITAENNKVKNGTEEVAIENVAYDKGAVVEAAGVAQIGTTKYATLQEALDAAEAAGTKNIVIDLLDDAELEINAWSGTTNKSAIGTAETESITINGNGHKLTFMTLNTDWNNVATMNDAVTKLTLNNMTIDQGGKNTKGTWNAYDINFNCAVELNNVTSNRPLAFKNDATLNNVTINDVNNKDVYGIWIQPNGQDVNIDGLTVTAKRGIKIDDQYVTAPDLTNLDIANATFNTTGTKPAILVKTAGGATITAGEGINIENVAADNTNLVWIDKAKSAEFYNVTVTGANIIPEGGEEAYVVSLVRGEQVRGYYATFAKAYSSTDYEEGDSYELHENTTETVEVSKALTIVKNGFTAANLTAAEGFQKTETDENITFVAFNPVAQIGDTKYETLEAAFAAAEDGATITLLADCAGNGIKAAQGKFGTNGLTVDFANHTYTVDGETVGSTGTETNGFQLLKDNKITFKNGTITSTKAKILVQNYSNLTLEGMTLTLNNANYTSAYTLSNNNGNVVIDGTTINANPAGGFAFDVCRYSSYTSVNVEVKGNSTINGNVEISATGSDAKDGFGLTLTSGTMSGNIVVDATAKAAMESTPEKATVTKANTFSKDAPEGFKWEVTGETSKLVAVNYVAQIGNEKYETLEAAFAAAEDGATITLLADCAGNGIKAAQGKFGTNGLTVDFANHTYTVDGETVGSTGTETNGFQLLKDNKITFKNGTITSTKAKILVQNYSNLTLDGMTLTLNNANYTSAYTLSNNNGNTVINSTTINANPAGGFAFDVCRFSSYPSVGVTVTGESKINGNVEISASKGDAKNGLSLNLNGGTMTGDIVVDASAATIIEKTPEKATVTKAEGFDQAAPEGYEWKDNGDGTSTLVEKTSYTFTDGTDTYTITTEKNNVSATYKRDFTDRTNKFQGWLVPFDYTITDTDIEKFEFREISKVEFADENKTKMQMRLGQPLAAGTTLEANKPYVFVPTTDVAVYEFTATSTTLKAADADAVRATFNVDDNTVVSFYGVYTSAHSDGNSYIYYMGKSGNIGYSKKINLTVGSFRWIFKITDGVGNSPSFAYTFGVAEDNNDDVTAVSSAAVEAEGEVVAYYTLAGQKVSEPTKGVYVVKYANGTSKKVVF